MGPLAGVGLRIGIGPVGTGPGPQVPEPVLHRHRVAGQVEDGPGDALLPRPRRRHPGQRLVDGGRPFQIGDGGRQLLVDRGQLGVDPPQLPGAGPPPAVEVGVLQGAAGLVGQDLEQELLVGAGLGGSADDQPAPVAAEAAQGEGPAPGGSGHVGRAVVGPEGHQPPGQRLAGPPRGLAEPFQLALPRRGRTGVPQFHPLELRNAGRVGGRAVGALGGTGAERRDRGDGQAEDLVLVPGLGHHHRQHEQAVEVRDLLPQPDHVGRLHPGRLSRLALRHRAPMVRPGVQPGR